MSVRPVELWPDPRLTQVCAPVEAPDPALIADLFDTMYAANGRGLAAPQIGVLHRVFVVDVSWKEGARRPQAFVNPIIRHVSEEVGTTEEQCLSIPDLPMPVTRPKTVTLDWRDASFSPQRAEFTGIEARCILHELDHLDGRVIFDHQDRASRAKLEAAYVA